MIAYPWSFAVESEYSSDSGQTVSITVYRETVSFSRETIRDGRLAGQMGHRQIPGQQSFELPPLSREEARQLRDQLTAALGERS